MKTSAARIQGYVSRFQRRLQQRRTVLLQPLFSDECCGERCVPRPDGTPEMFDDVRPRRSRVHNQRRLFTATAPANLDLDLQTGCRHLQALGRNLCDESRLLFRRVLTPHHALQSSGGHRRVALGPGCVRMTSGDVDGRVAASRRADLGVRIAALIFRACGPLDANHAPARWLSRSLL